MRERDGRERERDRQREGQTERGTDRERERDKWRLTVHCVDWEPPLRRLLLRVVCVLSGRVEAAGVE